MYKLIIRDEIGAIIRALLFSAALLTASVTYGQCKFRYGRYEPQCDHLPGVCIYGKGKGISRQYLEKENGETLRRLRISHGGSSIRVNATYPKTKGLPKKGLPKTVVVKEQGKSFSCDVEGPVQIILSQSDEPILKGCKNIHNFSPHLGLRDIYSSYLPLELVCVHSERWKTPELCKSSNKSAFTLSQLSVCRLDEALMKLSLKAKAPKLCLIEEARVMLVGGMDDVSYMNAKDIENAKVLINEMENRPEVPVVSGGFMERMGCLIWAWDNLPDIIVNKKLDRKNQK